MSTNKRIDLRAGPVSLVFDTGDLRYLRVAGYEIVRRIYVAVRDRNWNTVPAVLSNFVIDQKSDSFRIEYDADHTGGAISFAWHALIDGDPLGIIRFRMVGAARSTFLRNRIGVCVLHPMGCAGAECIVKHVGGAAEYANFPVAIAPHQPFLNIRSIAHQVRGELWAEVQMTGDVFEMEDQRNWTDASYKTYSTPLVLPYPVEIVAGTTLEQQVIVALRGSSTDEENDRQQLTFTVGMPSERRLPRIGLGLAAQSLPLTALERIRLKSLALTHLRVDLHLRDPEYSAWVELATSEAIALGMELELAVFVSDNAANELAALAEIVARLQTPVCTWLVFHEHESSTTGHWVRLARQYLSVVTPNARFGGGSNAYFVQLNRQRPPLDELDLVSYSINPQVHAFDDASLIETLAAQATTVESARVFCGALPIAISPITFRPRFNPDATAPAQASDGVSERIDSRQQTLFGAGWTLGSLKYLSESGVDTVTYYETVGLCGVMERGGAAVPDRVFPLFHVFADVGAFADGLVVGSHSSDPLKIDGMAVARNGMTRLLLANLSGEAQTIRLQGLAQQVRLRMLDAVSLESACLFPEDFRAQVGKPLDMIAGEYMLELPPYVVVCIDSMEVAEKSETTSYVMTQRNIQTV